MIDLPPPFWLPPKPAIIRAAPADLLRPELGMMGGIAPVIAGASPQGLEVTYADSAILGSTATSHTFSGMNFGPEAPDRKMIVCTNRATNIGRVSVVIGGVSMSTLYIAGDSNLQPEWWWCDLPSGTSGSVVVTDGFDSAGRGIGIFAVRGWGGTLHAGAKNGSSAVNNPSLTISCPADGAVLASARNIGNTAGSMAGDWSGIDDYFNRQSGNFQTSGGFRAYSAAGSISVSVAVSQATRLTAVAIGP